MARRAIAALVQRAGSFELVLASQLAYIPFRWAYLRACLHCFDFTNFFCQGGGKMALTCLISYLPNLCLLFGIACVTVMELERDLAFRNAAWHLHRPGRQGWPSKETGRSQKN